MYSEDDIIKKTAELTAAIQKTEEVAFYREVEKQIAQNQKISQRVDQIKALQKEVVNLEHYQKVNAAKEINDQIDTLQASINELPIVQQFRHSQMDVNELLQLMMRNMSISVNEEMEKSTTKE
ncbi:MULTISPECIES: RicAFT regulatory complex protein RicA family protein [Brochothrix]|uniref:Master regulator for biofilm formation via regulation of RNase Y n=1 Tax=Brochothrix thermosphacta TaxID=2756 RepID=A0A1D2L3A4_BROTH|nr:MULTISPECIES: YlbF family regulator [Brochothrix]SLM97465.1 YMCA protein [Brachybacterium faecium]ANZ94082.1 hypothetical protein BFC19_00870 [Brochothrix thermosphacta]ANZ97618.1 hypothetical protein BFC20_07895 [Brochothrix thermosphacta]ATF27065.1 hypothetical protein CNY62_12210 [Brochothrix thermosphacta]ATH86423.1 hypothetical protein CPF12_11895 [Brochothrix thermosphacta]